MSSTGSDSSGIVKAASPWAVLLLTALFALTTSLGYWQHQRAAQKRVLQVQMQQAEAAPLWRIDDARHLRFTDVAWRHLRVRGRFLPEGRVYLDNRAWRDRPGFYLLTPLLLEQGGVLMVNRGWLPRDPHDRTTLPNDCVPKGLVDVEGVTRADFGRALSFGTMAGAASAAAAPAAAASAAAASAAAPHIEQNLDLAALRKRMPQPLLPFVLLQTRAPQRGGCAADGLIQDWPGPSAEVVRHEGYCLQWWTMSLFILAGGIYWACLRWRAIRRAGKAPCVSGRGLK